MTFTVCCGHHLFFIGMYIFYYGIDSIIAMVFGRFNFGRGVVIFVFGINMSSRDFILCDHTKFSYR